SVDTVYFDQMHHFLSRQTAVLLRPVSIEVSQFVVLLIDVCFANVCIDVWMSLHIDYGYHCRFCLNYISMPFQVRLSSLIERKAARPVAQTTECSISP